MPRGSLGQSGNLPLPHKSHPKLQLLHSCRQANALFGLSVWIHINSWFIHSHHTSKVTSSHVVIIQGAMRKMLSQSLILEEERIKDIYLYGLNVIISWLLWIILLNESLHIGQTLTFPLFFIAAHYHTYVHVNLENLTLGEIPAWQYRLHKHIVMFVTAVCSNSIIRIF